VIKRQKRILIVTSLKDKKKSYLKKPLITTSDMFYHNLKKNYLNINCLVVRSHWQKKKINKKILYINKIYRYYLKRISKKLNTIHKVNYSDKYWSILIGIWLMRFICLSYDISENIKLVKKNGNLKNALHFL
jgi:putative transferase (TIGR04331 family)